VQKSRPDDLVFKTTDNALYHAPEASCEEPGLNATQQDELARVIAMVQQDFDAAVARQVDIKTAELRGKVDALLTLFGNRAHEHDVSRSDDVIDLPAGIIRKRNDAA